MDSELQCNGDLVTINNHKMHIYRKGNKDNPTLVFMSGGGTVSPVYDFKILYDKLIDYFRIIVIEKFGYGYSDIIECSHDIDTTVAIEKEALDILGEEAPYILVPHSMSGLEAIRWKQLYPKLVTGIIGIDMATPLSYKNWTGEKIAKEVKLLKFYRKLKIQNVPLLYPLSKRGLSKEEISQHRLLARRNAFNDCFIDEAIEVLQNAEVVENHGIEIECPTLLFSSNGKQVSKNWVEEQQKFALMQKAKLICYDCGHYIHYYKSNEMSEEIVKFMEELRDTDSRL